MDLFIPLKILPRQKNLYEAREGKKERKKGKRMGKKGREERERGSAVTFSSVLVGWILMKPWEMKLSAMIPPSFLPSFSFTHTLTKKLRITDQSNYRIWVRVTHSSLVPSLVAVRNKNKKHPGGC